MTNTKARHQEILAAATVAINRFGGVEAIDEMEPDKRKLKLRLLKVNVAAETHCTIDTARRNVAKAMHQARYGVMQDRRGGARSNTGPDPLLEDQKRQKTSPKLAYGSKELAQAIAEILGLPGWGHSVDLALMRMVEDPELKVKLAEMGITIKNQKEKIHG